jgi:hypothetical protein
MQSPRSSVAAGRPKKEESRMSDTWPNAARGAEETGIRRAAVIGAGSMGAGIAAQFANAGIPVELLDLPGTGPQNRNAPAEAGVARQLGIGGFTVPEAAALVRPGNVEDHLGRLSAADWIIEAVVENAALKKDLYARIALHRKPDAIVSSNTSTLLRGTLTSDMSDYVASHFLITHFFNPPRHMELLEVVAGPGCARRDRGACPPGRSRGAGQDDRCLLRYARFHRQSHGLLLDGRRRDRG